MVILYKDTNERKKSNLENLKQVFYFLQVMYFTSSKALQGHDTWLIFIIFSK